MALGNWSYIPYIWSYGPLLMTGVRAYLVGGYKSRLFGGMLLLFNRPEMGLNETNIDSSLE